MHIREYGITILASLIATPLVLLMIGVSSAQVMQSSNYSIESDSINFGGGLSSSNNYSLESTFGEVATGDSASTNFTLRAGYQQMDDAFISMSAPEAVVMSPSIPGVTGGVANGSTTVTVTTDSAAGYSLTISAETNPAMTSGSNSIADYVPGGDPDFTFTTDSGDAHFGYSPSGTDVVSRFLDNGTDTCNTGATETALACWDGLSTTDESIAVSSGSNMPLGTETVIHFRVGIGGSVIQAPGVYTATTTLTALPL